MFKPENGIEQHLTWIMGAHVGPENAISVDDLDRQLKMHEKEVQNVRQTIHDMRQKGYLVSSSPTGYFLPRNLNEAMDYIDTQLRTPARDILQTVRRQRQAAREHFGGQLSLFG